MKSFRRILAILVVLVAAVFFVANMALLRADSPDGGRPYRVEIYRMAQEIEEKGLEAVELTEYQYIVNVECFEKSDSEKRWEVFFHGKKDYLVREINGDLYRFDYVTSKASERGQTILLVNSLLAVMALVLSGVLFYIRYQILLPFERMADVPYELSKGNLTVPLMENKNRFFGRFVWGVDLLREHMEQQKQKESALHKEKKTLLLSLSHDIKTPLSAVKLYAKALSRGLYTEPEKQKEIAENINKKADEIEMYVSRIISASREDFLQLEVKDGEFYLSSLAGGLTGYYQEKLELIKTEFTVQRYLDCLLKGDFDRSMEVLQNIMENAVKYGDGSRIEVQFGEEDGCVLCSVRNNGCTLSDTELPHIFESFWRGANTGKQPGSGLGLYISRQLMYKMGGDIFAEVRDGMMIVTLVFQKA
ncbi:MAG: HAMP domain-containing histidine kinase [Lachnospiraceae bacterium]|nr:HAMP domain-containing histidine kinase [Lachnospiraceae bacterium]